MERSRRFESQWPGGRKQGSVYELSLGRNVSAVFLLSASFVIASHAQTLTTVASFNGINGVQPLASVDQGIDRNLYGTASMGGAHSYGTIFKISLSGTLTTLHSFDGIDGKTPMAGLIQATDGNFYGTTAVGGFNSCAPWAVTIVPPPVIPNDVLKPDPPTGLKIVLSGSQAVLQWTAPVVLKGGRLEARYQLVASSPGLWISLGLIQPTVTQLVLPVLPPGTLYTVELRSVNDAGVPSDWVTISYKPLSLPPQSAPNKRPADTNEALFPGVPVATPGCGTIFKITPAGTLTALHSFCAQTNCTDGRNPVAALVQAADGNFYGTTLAGGGNKVCANGCGTIFKMTPGGELTTLYTFSGTDGSHPQAALVQGTDGDFYGTTYDGGANSCPAIAPVYGCGTIFKVTPRGALLTLHKFTGTPGPSFLEEGQWPHGALKQATDGNFYGTTLAGGNTYSKDGTVFRITAQGTLTTLHSFGFAGGAAPSGALIQATDGNFYGTTLAGGFAGFGTIFEITSSGKVTTLHAFDGYDSEYPVGIVQTIDGNFYGTCSGNAGVVSPVPDDGIVFRLTSTFPPISPVIAQSGAVLNGASFQAGIVPNSWITIIGTNLSPKTDTWANAINGGNLPTSLDGVSVILGGKPAYISYISPTQVNALAPNVGSGVMSVTVTNSAGTSSAAMALAQMVQPAFSSGIPTQSQPDRITA